MASGRSLAVDAEGGRLGSLAPRRQQGLLGHRRASILLLDSSEPELTLSGLLPVPAPGLCHPLKRRSLVPVPDWERYAIHFRKISDLTGPHLPAARQASA
jgi:hypothetical protein